eukprot:GHVR01046843.1.p1 GENE.GHVR01046843.1~~GHVR01046843.1.p1  ORF type:complete len:100 (+),score=13.50 GHVR01046843.1:525-824(+)
MHLPAKLDFLIDGKSVKELAKVNCAVKEKLHTFTFIIYIYAQDMPKANAAQLSTPQTKKQVDIAASVVSKLDMASLSGDGKTRPSLKQKMANLETQAEQ